MKHLLLLVAMLLLFAQAGFGQTKRAARTGFMRSPVHASGVARGSAPVNDDCTNAQVVAVTADCTAPVMGDNALATDDGPDVPCDDPGSTLLDMWYTFNSGDQDSVALTLTPSAQMTDWDFVVYDGCGGAEVLCTITPAAPVTVPVAPHTDYWIRVYSNTAYGDGGPFTLCVSLPVQIAIPANDVCADVTPQALAVGGSLTFNGTNLGATDDEGFGYPTVWESFSLSTCADVKIDYCGTTPAWHGFWTVLYPGCLPSAGVFAGSYDSTACGDGNFTLCFADLPAGDYYYPLLQTVRSLGAYALNVSAVACGSEEAANDECAGAIPISAHPTCQVSSFVAPCATQSMPAVTCGTFAGDAADDVWYSFTATATDMTVGGAPHGNMDIVMEMFSGTCDALTSIACGDVGGEGAADDMVATGLTVGSTYYFRVYDFRTQYAYAEPGYDLCVVDGVGSGVGVDGPVDASASPAIYPNPTDGDFNVQVERNATNVTITVQDAAGRLVQDLSARPDASGTVRVDANGMAPGLYVVRCNVGRSITSGTLVVR